MRKRQMRKRCHSFDRVQREYNTPPSIDSHYKIPAEAQQTGNLLFVYSAVRVACSAHGFFPEVAPPSADADPHFTHGGATVFIPPHDLALTSRGRH